MSLIVAAEIVGTRLLPKHTCKRSSLLHGTLRTNLLVRWDLIIDTTQRTVLGYVQLVEDKPSEVSYAVVVNVSSRKVVHRPMYMTCTSLDIPFWISIHENGRCSRAALGLMRQSIWRQSIGAYRCYGLFQILRYLSCRASGIFGWTHSIVRGCFVPLLPLFLIPLRQTPPPSFPPLSQRHVYAAPGFLPLLQAVPFISKFVFDWVP